jgi:hypothetical protein
MTNDQQHPYGEYDQHGQYDQYGRPLQDPQQQAPYDTYRNPGAAAQGQDQGQDPYREAQQDPDAGPQIAQGWGEASPHASPHASPYASPYDPYDSAQPPVPDALDQHDRGMTQTWDGQTWDTHYQPPVQWEQPQQAQQPPPTEHPRQAQHPQGQATYRPRHAQQAAVDTAQPAAQVARPLPPETPGPPPQHTSGQHVSAPFAAAAGPPPATPGQPGSLVDPVAYSPPTTMGNARITDAQRARAEGRSPIIAPGMQPAALTAVLGLLLAAGAAIGPYALLVPLVLLQAVTAAGWFRLNGMWPARQGIVLAFAGGLAADAALLAFGKENAPAAIIGTLGVWVLLTLVLQLRSHAGSDERMQGLMATVASAALAILATGHLAAVPDAVVVGALAVAVATVARALPLPGIASVTVALLAAAGAGVAAGGLTDLGAKGALLGLAAGVCALIGLRAASYDYPSRFVHMTAGVALPLTAAAPAVYLLGRALA